MTDSHITNVLNDLSTAAVASAFMGAVGYFGARAIGYLGTYTVNYLGSFAPDPRLGFVSGAAAGAILCLFGNEETNRATKIVGLAALIFVPFHVCQRLELPGTFKTVVAMTAATLTTSLLFLGLFAYAFSNNNKDT